MARVDRRRVGGRLAGCAAVLAALLVISPGVGSQLSAVGWQTAWRVKLGLPLDPTRLADHSLVDLDGDGAASDHELESYRALVKSIGFDQRFARSLLALVVGVTLALCGGTFQVLFRNALATPYTLGIAGGASLGAVIAIRLGLTASRFGLSPVMLCAFAGGIAVVAAVLAIARGSRRLTSNELLLAGVTIGMFCAAMMMAVQTISNERQTFRMIQWMLGSLNTITNAKAATIFPFVLPCWIVLLLSSRALNQYRLGDELAESRGVPIARLQIGCVIVATLGTAAVAAHCGPIGFVGLVVPHMVTLLVGPDCRVMLPAAALVGGAFTMVCDWASQLAMPAAGALLGRDLGGALLPIGTVTALIGVPVFLVILRTGRFRVAAD